MQRTYSIMMMPKARKMGVGRLLASLKYEYFFGPSKQYSNYPKQDLIEKKTILKRNLTSICKLRNRNRSTKHRHRIFCFVTVLANERDALLHPHVPHTVHPEVASFGKCSSYYNVCKYHVSSRHASGEALNSLRNL